MKHLWQRMIHKVARKLKLYGTLDSEKALRDKNTEILHLKRELEEHRGFTAVRIDPARMGAYDQPSPVTNPQLLARLEARKRREHLQVEIRREYERKEDMKGYVAKITGKPEQSILTDELPHMTGELQRLWKSYQTQYQEPPPLKDDMKKFLDCETNELPTVTGDLARKHHATQTLKRINLTRPTQKLDPDDAWPL